MEILKQIVRTLLPQEPFDALAVGVIDFRNDEFSSFEASQLNSQISFDETQRNYFDLASLTKPLTNSLSYFLKREAYDEKMLLCLNHQAGLPAWGLLPKRDWKELIFSYPIKESPTLYSDFSALRVMLELEKKGIDQKKICQDIWDQETVYWLDLPSAAPLLQFGFKNGLPNLGAVHDPNAWTIGEFCSHAGVFSTIEGVCRTLINYQQKTGFIEQVRNDLGTHQHRFAYGWDRVENPENTLAGTGCGKFTFGHLGFTGTSIWIDPDRMLGHVILSNATKYHWYDKAGLNDLRRAIGEKVWSRDL